MDLLKLFVEAVCEIAMEFKAHNALYRQELTEVEKIAVNPTSPAPVEDVERPEIIRQLTELGEKVHGKTSTPNLKKKLDELLAVLPGAKKEAPAEAQEPDPFVTTEGTAAPTIEQVRAALIACAKVKGVEPVKDMQEKVSGTRKLTEVKPEFYRCFGCRSQQVRNRGVISPGKEKESLCPLIKSTARELAKRAKAGVAWRIALFPGDPRTVEIDGFKIRHRRGPGGLSYHQSLEKG